jgi:hypothetical protein
MDRYPHFPYPYCAHPQGYERYHAYPCPEPWSRQRTIATWVVTWVCLVALAIGLPIVRNANERSWCSGGVGAPVSQQCLDGQRAIRCGPLGIFHCPEGGD